MFVHQHRRRSHVHVQLLFAISAALVCIVSAAPPPPPPPPAHRPSRHYYSYRGKLPKFSDYDNGFNYVDESKSIESTSNSYEDNALNEKLDYIDEEEQRNVLENEELLLIRKLRKLLNDEYVSLNSNRNKRNERKSYIPDAAACYWKLCPLGKRRVKSLESE